MNVTMPELETYSRVEAARRLGLAVGTLRRMAADGRGPRYSRTGDVKGRVIYTAADLAEWLKERKQAPRVCRGQSGNTGA